MTITPPRTPVQADRWRTRKWDVGRDAIGAWIAESDFGTAPAVVRALHEAVDAGFLTYLPTHAAWRAEAACASFLRSRYGWDLPPERVHLIPDVVEGLRLAITRFSRPDAAIAVPTPCYTPFLDAPRRLGREVVQVPSVVDAGRWHIDLDALDTALAGGAGLVVLCNPHNPLGQVMEPEEMLALAEVVDRHGARVFSDEIHAPIVYPGATHTPYASLCETTAQHTITATATSKGWNIPGLKAAQLILTSDADQTSWVEQDIVPAQVGSILGAVAAATAYTEGVEWLDEVLVRFDDNRRLLDHLLEELAPGVGFVRPQATYLAWLDFAAYELPTSAAQFLKDVAGLIVTDGAQCGIGGEHHIRFNFAMDPRLLEQSVHRIATALEPYASGVA